VRIVDDGLRELCVDEVGVSTLCVGWTKTTAARRSSSSHRASKVIGRSISGIERNAVGLEVVKSLSDFGECGWQVVVLVWKCDEEAKFGGRGITDGGCVYVDGAGKFRGAFAVKDSTAGPGEGEDRSTNTLGGHETLAALNTPSRETPPRWIATGLVECWCQGQLRERYPEEYEMSPST